MHISFTAQAISISPVDGILTVALLEKTSGEGRFVLLKRGDAQGGAGKTEHALELSGQSCSAYGAVAGVELARATLRLSLTEEAVRLLGVREVTVTHELKGADFNRLLSALKRILGQARIRFALPSNQEIGQALRIEGEGDDAFGKLELFVPAFERHFVFQIDLRDPSGISPNSVRIIADVLTMDSAARAKVTGLLYQHALKTAQEVAFGDKGSDVPATPGLVGRLFARFGKNRFVPVPMDDPRHPCYLEKGIDSVERKVEWIGFRIDERAIVASRLCVLDCRPEWDEENGVALVIRNGIPVGTSDADVNIEDFDRP